MPGNGIPSKLTAMNPLRPEVTGTAWKIEAPVCAPLAGTVQQVHVSAGEAVTDDQAVSAVG